jgi:NAD+ synthase (glutamine-hydrolysing)
MYSARYRVGPELEISGYGCEDHFLENDTFQHSWDCMAEILSNQNIHDILCDIGMPIMHKNVRYVESFITA